MFNVSIILPSFNHRPFLKERLDSILNQTYTNWSLIIIDDCSTDGSIEILQKFYKENENKISHFLVNKTNSGSGYKSWKKGIELSRSKYIWIAETDDFSHPIFLEEQVKILERNPKLVFSFCASNYIDENGKELYNTDNRMSDLNVGENDFNTFSNEDFFKKMPFNTYITNGSSVVFRNPDKKLPDIIFNNPRFSDQFLWTYLVMEENFAYLNKKLNYFRRHETSTTEIQEKKNNGYYYIEIVRYVNLFKFTDKHMEVIKHYIKHFIWNKKTNIINTSYIEGINGVSYLKLKYYLALMKFMFFKITGKNGK